MTITSFPRRVAVAGSGLTRGFVAMRHPNYRRFWLGQIGSLVGTWMQSVALPWLVLELGGSPLQLGLVMAFLFGPSMIIAPLGGVLADRLDRRRTLIIANAIAMVQALALFTLAFTGVVEIWHVYALALVAGLVSAIEMPVRQAFVAELVPREDLVNAIALSSTSFNLSRVIGPAVAGLTIAAFGVWSNFAINAISYVSVLVGLLRVDPRGLHAAPRPGRLPIDPVEPGRGPALRALDARGAVAARPAGRDGRAGHELPDAAAPLHARRARDGLGRIRRALRGHGLRVADRIADAGLRDQPAAAVALHHRRRRRLSWCSLSSSASPARRPSRSRSSSAWASRRC